MTVTVLNHEQSFHLLAVGSGLFLIAPVDLYKSSQGVQIVKNCDGLNFYLTCWQEAQVRDRRTVPYSQQ